LESALKGGSETECDAAFASLSEHRAGALIVEFRPVSDLNKKIYGTIEAWRNRPIEGEHPYVYLDGIVLKRSWAGEVRNVSLLVAIGVNERGYREILGI
jgi:transposase-like protein